MKIIDLIPYLKTSEGLNRLYQQEKLSLESEAILIYMKESLSIESDLVFFAIEETKDDLLFNKDGHTYLQLFPVEYAKELIEELSAHINTNLEIARRLLEYRIKDA